MNINQIQYALTVARYKNFSKAAESLFLSQPALSLQIKKLEQELKEELEKNLEKKLAAQGISCGNQSVATKVQGVTEHLRWNAYMRALGYRQYALRSDRVKLHPLIVPYHSLSQDEQTKDIIEFE